MKANPATDEQIEDALREIQSEAESASHDLCIDRDGCYQSIAEAKDVIRDRIRSDAKELEKLRMFKKNTHILLDEADVPPFEDEDCRVSHRIRWLHRELIVACAELERLRRYETPSEPVQYGEQRFISDDQSRGSSIGPVADNPAPRPVPVGERLPPIDLEEIEPLWDIHVVQSLLAACGPGCKGVTPEAYGQALRQIRTAIVELERLKRGDWAEAAAKEYNPGDTHRLSGIILKHLSLPAPASVPSPELLALIAAGGGICDACGEPKPKLYRADARGPHHAAVGLVVCSDCCSGVKA